MEGDYYSTLEVLEFEDYYLQIIEQQQEQIDVLKLGFQFTISMIGVILGTIVITILIRSIFRHVGNWRNIIN